MIYVASLLIAKKAMGSKCHQTSIARIIEMLSMDPETSSMDVVILGPADLQGLHKKKVQSAVANKHPDVCCIYIYSNDKEKGLLECEYKKHAKKITDTVIEEAVKEFYGEHSIRTKKTDVISRDDRDPELHLHNPKPTYIEEEAPAPAPVRVEQDSRRDLSALAEELGRFERKPAGTPVSDDKGQIGNPTEVPTAPMPNAVAWGEDTEKVITPTEPGASMTDAVINSILQPVADPTPKPDTSVPVPVEDRIAAVTNFTDWDLFKRQLNRDSVVRRLIEENTEFVGIRDMLEVWDIKIRQTFSDPLLSDSEKFEKIKEFGTQRSMLKASENQIVCEKMIKVFSAVVEAADKTVKRRLNEVQQSVYKLTADKEAIARGVNLQPLFQKRMDLQLELLEGVRKIIEVYKFMDKTVTDQLNEMDKNLPSSNEYINTVLFPVKNIFLPTNTSGLATMLMTSLQHGRVAMSSMQESIESTIHSIIKLGETDEELIAYMQNVINVLQAQRVEDVVIRDTLIKDILRLYVGCDDTGRTATAVTWSGIMARRVNTLVIDLSKNSKAETYGVEPVTLDAFMAERMQRPFLYVKGSLDGDPEKIQLFMQEVRSRIDYYQCINVVLDDTQEAELDQLSQDALSVTYITDCTTRSLESMKPVIQRHKSTNIARRLVLIDMPLDINQMVEAIGMSMTTTKVIPIPYLREMRACAIRNVAPYENTDIVTVFEEAFR